MQKAKYIVILGTIMSGLGKGVLSSSIGVLLKKRGYVVAPLKFDGYLNYDCGTMNPYRHGEVFVLEDGSEVDMDFGTYERFLGQNLMGEGSLTGGKVLKTIIDKERKGEYLGYDVQFIPHVTDFIKNYIKEYAEHTKADICIVEVGGTVGDIENNYFIEAMRQLAIDEQVLFMQLTYVPELPSGEQKTKPTQHANRIIRGFGIKPEIIVGRSKRLLRKEVREKIALYSNVHADAVFSSPDVEIIYELPLILEKQGIYEKISNNLGLEKKEADFSEWNRRIENLKHAAKSKRIAIVGKYAYEQSKDVYISLYEALMHAGCELSIRPIINIINSEEIKKNSTSILEKYDGIIIPGGFGKRGIEGKIKAIEYARKNKKPLLGLCLGMQLMVVEYARNVVGLKDAHSTEFAKTQNPVIDLLPQQKGVKQKGGTMRLGGYEMEIKEGTKMYEAFRKHSVVLRHRHRYEVNPTYVDTLEKHGLVVCGKHKHIVEAVEYKDSLGIGTQSHPELSSKFEKPNELFVYFLKNA